jgi:hypothetical protein
VTPDATDSARDGSDSPSQVVRRTVRSAGAAAVGLLFTVAVVASGHTSPFWNSPAPVQPLRIIQTHLVDDALDPSVVVLDPGPVRFEITNDSQDAQRFVVHGPGTFARTAALPAGGTATLDVTLGDAGAYELESVSPSGGVTSRGNLEVRR